MAVCSICLRTNLNLTTTHQTLVSFYDDLLEHDEIISLLKLCVNCERLLKKCYDFKHLCQKSNKIFQDWKKNKKTEISSENLHSLIQPYYDKVSETTEKEIKTEQKNVNTIVLTNNDNLILNKDNRNEYNYNEVEVKDEDNKNNEGLFRNNDIFMETNFPIKPKQERGLNLSDNEHNRIGNSSNKEHSRIGHNSEKECNRIRRNSDNEDDRIGDNSDNEDNSIDEDSSGSEEIEFVGKKAKRKKQTMNKIGENKKRKRREKKPLQNKEKFESIFDIIYFKTDEEAKAELMDRPNSDYYKNATFKCTICYIVFKCQKLMDYHMKWHDPSAGDHPCNVCEMRYKSRRSMMYHKYTSHFGRYSCKMCPHVTYHKPVMMRHSENHQNLQYKCKLCDETYDQKSAYLQHMRVTHASHACPLCARTFISPDRLKRHIAMVHQTTTAVETESSVKCEECNLTFSNQDVYIVHVMNTPCHKDMASAMIACPVCGLRFDDVPSLREHKRQLHPSQWRKTKRRREEIEVTCEECGASGGNYYWLYAHYRKEHPQLPYKVAREKKHMCDQCGKSFTLRSGLLEHAPVHTGERPHVCSECGTAFSTKRKLKLHSETHKPPSRACTVCGKKFVSSSNLNNHMKGHIGDRRYKCSLCDKGFLHSAALREHERGVHQHVRREKKSRQGKLTQKN